MIEHFHEKFNSMTSYLSALNVQCSLTAIREYSSWVVDIALGSAREEGEVVTTIEVEVKSSTSFIAVWGVSRTAVRYYAIMNW